VGLFSVAELTTRRTQAATSSSPERRSSSPALHLGRTRWNCVCLE